MKERPILFSAPMVRALRDGRKTQTRRVVRLSDGGHGSHVPPDVACPYGEPGDRLWVREAWHACPHCGHDPVPTSGGVVSYRAGGWARVPDGDRSDVDDSDRPLRPKCAAHGWRPPLFMPRWASRITLEVTAVRVERLQDITEEDARAEGVEASATTWVRHEPSGDWELSTEPFDGATPERATARDVYARLWDEINGKRAPWSSNPWVWVVSFRRVAP